MTLAKLLGPDASVSEVAGALPVVGLTADSRGVKPGVVFAALPGTGVDGAKSIGQALARGVIAAISGQGDKAWPG